MNRRPSTTARCPATRAAPGPRRRVGAVRTAGSRGRPHPEPDRPEDRADPRPRGPKPRGSAPSSPSSALGHRGLGPGRGRGLDPAVRRPLERRVSDAVLFVPEGIAVVRVAEVVRQSGVVTVLPEGSWTIGPGPVRATCCSSPGRLDPAGRAHAGRHGDRRTAAPGGPRARPDRPADRAHGDVTACFPPTVTSARATRSPCSSPARCCSASPAPAATPASTSPASGRRPTSGPPPRRSA